MLLGLLLFAGTPRIVNDLYDDRWQFWYDTVLWDFVIDRTPHGFNEDLHIAWFIPDFLCRDSLGTFTGAIHVAFNSVPGDTNWYVRVYGGKLWGRRACDVPEWTWASSKLERLK